MDCRRTIKILNIVIIATKVSETFILHIIESHSFIYFLITGY